METNINLELTLAQLNVVLVGLSKLPIEVGLDTFNIVRNQAQSQVQNTQAPTVTTLKTETTED